MLTLPARTLRDDTLQLCSDAHQLLDADLNIDQVPTCYGLVRATIAAVLQEQLAIAEVDLQLKTPVRHPTPRHHAGLF